jgi:glycosyltransferase involved in cell wall biosynthesis
LDTRLRPLIFLPRYWPHLGGAEIHTRRLAQELSQHCDPSIACIGTEEIGEIDRAYATGQTRSYSDTQLAVTELRASELARIPLAALSAIWESGRLPRGVYRKLTAHLLKQQFRSMASKHDLIHGVYNGFTASAVAASRSGLPFVWTPLVHAEHKPGTAWSSPQFLKLYQRADALIAMTEFERDWLIRHGAKADCVHVCPAAPMQESQGQAGRFRTQYDLGDSPMVLFLGRLVPSKGFQFLLDASAQIWEHHPDTRIVLIGDVDDAARDVVNRHGDKRIIVTGRLSDGERDDALAACNMLCVPSDQESLGVIYLEAWAQGKPVIAADIDVLKTLIDDGETGVLVQRSADSISKAVKALLDNPQRALVMGLEGQNRVHTQYNWERTSQKVLEIYNHIARTR